MFLNVLEQEFCKGRCSVRPTQIIRRLSFFHAIEKTALEGVYPPVSLICRKSSEKARSERKSPYSLRTKTTWNCSGFIISFANGASNSSRLCTIWPES